jgi:glycosyltransferase involved in cell wall biosynthesis
MATKAQDNAAAGAATPIVDRGARTDVVHIIISDRRAGMEAMMMSLASHAVGSGKKVLVVVPPTDRLDSLATDALAAGADVERIGPLHFETRRGLVRRLRVGVALYRVIRRTRPSVVHIHFPWVAMCPEAIVVSRLAGAHWIVRTEHNPIGSPLSRLQRWKLVVLDACVDRFVFVSRGNLQSHMDNSARRGARSVVIANGVDMPAAVSDAAERASLRRSLGFSRTGPICVMVGVLEERKGVLDFVRAAAVASRVAPAMQFAVVGDGPLRQSAEHLVDDFQLGDCVRFLGRCDDVRRILPAFDIYAQPSLFEGLSIAMLEALAAGLPMVTTQVDGVAEVFPDGRDVLTVAVGDTQALGEAMARLANDPELCRQLSSASMSRIRAGFTASGMASSYDHLYQDLVVDPGLPHRRLFRGRLAYLPRPSR